MLTTALILSTLMAPSPAALTTRLSTVSAQALDIGGAHFALKSGQASEIAGPDGKPIGFLFEGEGSLTWNAGSPEASKVYADNAKRVGGLATEKDGSLSAKFTRASFYFSDAVRPDINFEAGAAAPADHFSAHLARFGKDEFRKPETGLAVAAAEGRKYASVLIEGSKDIRFEYDDAISDEETLAVVAPMEVTPSGFVDWRFSRVVGRRPIGRERRAISRVDYRLVDLDVDVREKEQGWGHFAVEETVVPEHPLHSLVFRLASETILNKGLDEAKTKLESVTGEDGKALPFTLAKGTLAVFFPDGLPAKAPRKLRFTYDAPFLGRQSGDNYWDLGLDEPWHPEPFSPAATATAFHCVIRAKKPLVPFASGSTLKRAEEGEWNLVETRPVRPVFDVMVLAGPYTIQEETQDRITCRVASYAVKKEKSGARITNLFHNIRRFYEPYFGPFPWKEYDVVEVNDFGYGQAPPRAHADHARGLPGEHPRRCRGRVLLRRHQRTDRP